MEVGASIQTAVYYQSGQIQADGGDHQSSRSWGAHRGWGGYRGHGGHRGAGGYSGSTPAERALQGCGNGPGQVAAKDPDLCSFSRNSQAVSLVQDLALEQKENSLTFGINLVYRKRSVSLENQGESGGVQKTIENLLVNIHAEFRIFMDDGTGAVETGESGDWDTALNDALTGLQDLFGANVAQVRDQFYLTGNGIATVLDQLDQIFNQLMSGLRSVFGISEETGLPAGETNSPALEAVPVGDEVDVSENTGTNDVLVSGLAGDQETAADDTDTEAVTAQGDAGPSSLEASVEAAGAEDTERATGEAGAANVAASDESAQEPSASNGDNTAAGAGFITRLQSVYAKSRIELVTSLNQTQVGASEEKQSGTSLRLQSSMAYGYQYYQSPNMTGTSLYYRQNLGLQLIV